MKAKNARPVNDQALKYAECYGDDLAHQEVVLGGR